MKAYREALTLDPDDAAIQNAAAHAEQKHKASVLHRRAVESTKRADFSLASKLFAVAMMCDSELGAHAQAPKEDCERKASALQLVSQGDLQLEHEQLDPAIQAFSEALELWGADDAPQ
eukprot:COSAG02_NODE_20183_length_845_cov_0.722520_2_plen_117_part_01